jgi:hypothetical protein
MSIFYVPYYDILTHCQWLFNPPLPSLVSYLSALVGPISPFLLRVLFWRWPSHQREIVQRLIQSPSSVFAALTMAYHEMQTLRALDVELLNKLKSRIMWLYGSVDGWVGIHGDEIIRHLGSEIAAKHIQYANLPHAFCICRLSRAIQSMFINRSFSPQQRDSYHLHGLA